LQRLSDERFLLVIPAKAGIQGVNGSRALRATQKLCAGGSAPAPWVTFFARAKKVTKESTPPERATPSSVPRPTGRSTNSPGAKYAPRARTRSRLTTPGGSAVLSARYGDPEAVTFFISHPLSRVEPQEKKKRRVGIARLIRVQAILCSIILGVISDQSYAASLDVEKEHTCKGTADWSKCAAKIELSRINRYSKLVVRKGDTLELTLENGKVLQLKDSKGKSKADQGSRYEFDDYIDHMDSFLIKKDYYESDRYLLVGRKYGTITEIDGWPLFSHDKKHFVTVSICDQHCPDRLQIWKQQQLMWSFRPYEYWAHATAMWEDDKTVKITKSVKEDPKDRSADFVKKSFHIKLMSDGWRISDIN